MSMLPTKTLADLSRYPKLPTNMSHRKYGSVDGAVDGGYTVNDS